MKPYPLLFHPLLHPRVWGGRTLESLGKPLPPGEAIGESWELADLPDSIKNGRSVIANGDLAGCTLREALQRHSGLILGTAKRSPEGGFPLLIKYLDAREKLSVQVHPDQAYVARHPEAHLKSEAWVVIDAKPGSVIYKGLRPGITKAMFIEHVKDGTVESTLNAVPVKPGDCHYLPSGTCHALGAGILAAEVQTPSDTTFRVYDWGRQGRELHIAQALECIRFDNHHESPGPNQPMEIDGIRSTPLAETEYFGIERVSPCGGASFDIVPSGMPEIWMMIAGVGDIHSPGGGRTRLGRGVTVLIPAALDGSQAAFSIDSEFLRITLPSPLKGMLASTCGD